MWFERALYGYLCREHIENRPTPCPLAFMVTDVGARDPKVRNAYTRVYKNLVRLMKTRLKDSGVTDKDEAALAITALMIGGVAIGRALNSTTATDKLLAGWRNVAEKILGQT